jgi:VWA domain-containing protein
VADVQDVPRCFRFLAFALFLLAGCRHNRVAPSAASTKSSKHVNVVMVVDRSGSLETSGSCKALIASATAFVEQFARGQGKLGLVTFATSTYVNFPVANNFQTAQPNVAAILSNVKCTGSTSSAQALWTGYQQLIALKKPRSHNVILFFTDGQPTGVTVDMPIAKSSACRAFTPGSPKGADAYTMPPAGEGYIRGVYSTYTNQAQFFGLQNQDGVTGPNGLQTVSNSDFEPAKGSTGCAYFSHWPASATVTSDFLGLPVKDVYGNSLNTSYRPVTLNSDGFIDLKNPQNAQAMAANAADSAARNIRNGAVDPVSRRRLRNVVIYGIGLGNAPYPLSTEFLERVANDRRSPVFDSSQRTGAVLLSPTSADLRDAFNAISKILADLK